MKTRFGINRTTRHRELLVQSRKGEELNPHQAAWLEHLNHENFLRVSYDVSGEAERCTIAYDVNGLVSFGRYIRKCVLSGENLVGMLTDLACAYGTCTSGQNKRFWQQSMLFDKRYVFIDDVATLRFVFIPLDGLPFTVENSPLVLLQVLGDTRRVKYATPNDYSLARNLYSYALNEQGTFSFNSYRTFLRNECGVEVDPDGTVRGGETIRERLVPGARDEVRGGHVRPAVKTPGIPGIQVAPNPGVDPRGIRDTLGRGVAHGYRLQRISTGEVYDIVESQQIVLGRGSSCNPQLLGNPKLSRKHAAIQIQDNSLIITDLGSANGTYINHRKLPENQPIRVRVDQEFTLDSEQFRIDRR
ncbi:MAG: FHA domain-containing protein [Atopobiaceae bacterium]|nr:FHA domain-containing protein [Atopobiaceae bacterium]